MASHHNNNQHAYNPKKEYLAQALRCIFKTAEEQFESQYKIISLKARVLYWDKKSFIKKELDNLKLKIKEDIIKPFIHEHYFLYDKGETQREIINYQPNKEDPASYDIDKVCPLKSDDPSDIYDCIDVNMDRMSDDAFAILCAELGDL